jgi:hypothetical protein
MIPFTKCCSLDMKHHQQEGRALNLAISLEPDPKSTDDRRSRMTLGSLNPSDKTSANIAGALGFDSNSAVYLGFCLRILLCRCRACIHKHPPWAVSKVQFQFQCFLTDHGGGEIWGVSHLTLEAREDLQYNPDNVYSCTAK